MARHAFISHSHKDAEASNAIVAALESRGVKCWTAPRDVTPGGSYAESIITAIENSSCFVLVYTQNSNVSPHVLREVERALALGINIIPLRFDDSSISKSLDYLLATVHWLSVIAEPRHTAIRDAADRIASCVIAPNEPAPIVPPVPLPVPPPAPPARPVEKTPVMLWLLLLLVGLAVIGLSVVTVRRLTSRQEAVPPPVETPSPTPAPTAVAIESVPVTPAPTIAALPTATPATPETTATPEIAASATPVPIVADVSTPAPPPTPAEEAADTASENAETTPESTPTPEARPPVNDTPLAAVRRYYAYLGDRNTIKAYELLSTNYRSRETFVNYTRSFASTTGLSLSNAHLTTNNGNTASVSVTFRKNNQKFGWITWSGPVELVREDGGWRIESTKGLRATRARR
jgi:hypothetical protein